MPNIEGGKLRGKVKILRGSFNRVKDEDNKIGVKKLFRCRHLYVTEQRSVSPFTIIIES